ncbi:hypothetical protein [Eudoraea sp.]|uniref:hypothetical protein n=1 Tax=Eudoraea sp. TaxID=1979955 RepID=UPI003C7101F5
MITAILASITSVLLLMFLLPQFNILIEKQLELRLLDSTHLLSLIGHYYFLFGLFGLAAYTTDQRKKEIGERKVLGSSVTEIVQLLSKDFMSLVLVALFIAALSPGGLCKIGWKVLPIVLRLTYEYVLLQVLSLFVLPC